MNHLYVVKFFYYARIIAFSYAVNLMTVYLYKKNFEKSANPTIIATKDFLRKNMTLASCFTLCRLWLIFPICEAIAFQDWTRAFWYTVLAGFTDVFDGFCARYFKQETYFGAFLDALVDKILISSVVWVLLQTIKMPMPFKILGISIIVKEIVQLIASCYLLVKGKLPTIKPSLWGKASMCGQLFFVLFLILNNNCNYPFSWLVTVPIFGLLGISALAYVSLFIKLINI